MESTLLLSVPLALKLILHCVFCSRVCNKCIPGAYGDPERVLEPMELKVEMVVSLLVGAGNRIRVLWKSTQDSSPRSQTSQRVLEKSI